ncbi:MAG: agmatinase family protein [Rikenellaceae bacterium]|nr:agmatinase family protein [Rikenellaceae bacterium]
MDFADFDPDGTGQDNGNYFGLPFTPKESRLVLLSVPWDVTASYTDGARFGPDAIIGASTQLDLYDPVSPEQWRKGIGTIGIDYGIQEKSQFLREEARKVIKYLEGGGKVTDEYVERRTERINAASAEMNEYVYGSSKKWLEAGKLTGLVGGDHSTPLGLIGALAEKYGTLSILHIDAHADLREKYEGFEYSHASIMYNVITRIPGVESLVQVGVRDLCDSEAQLAATDPRIRMFHGWELARDGFRGMTWDKQCRRIVENLGENVYISFDIDGLSPLYAPHTGTPVPGGLTFDQAVYLADMAASEGRKVVGFDLCEVAPGKEGEWDGNAGARILYKLCGIALKSNQ